MIRNSTPTILISEKIRPSRNPTKIVGSAAGNRIFQNCCERVRLKLRPTLMSTRRVPAEAFQRLEDDRRKPGGEAHHHDGHGAAAEDDQIERIHQHERRSRNRRHPGLGRKPQQVIAVEQHAAGHAEDRDQDAGRERLAGGEQEALTARSPR